MRVKSRFFEFFSLLLFSIYALIPMNPSNMIFTFRDSGVFLYLGWRILNGELPYLDIWDHKPPVVYFINALGLAFSDNTKWGIWALELISLFITLSLGYFLLKKLFGSPSAWISIVLMVCTFQSVIDGGNLPPEYALPLQVASFWLILKQENSRHILLWGLIGVLGGISFFLKQTTIGIWLAIAVYQGISLLFNKNYSKKIVELVIFITGGVIVTVLILAIWSGQGGIARFYDNVFRYNLFYSLSAQTLYDRIIPAIFGLDMLAKVGMLQFSLAGYLLGIILVITKKEIFHTGKPLLYIGLIALPIELLLISVSGRIYPHYYISIFPILLFFSGLCFNGLQHLFRIIKFPSFTIYAVQVSIIVFIFFISIPDYIDKYRWYFNSRDDPSIPYILNTTSEDDFVLLWGAESYVNFFSTRRSPSRFVYQYPLYTTGYVNEKMILEFLNDIILKKPKLIIDTRNQRTPFLVFPIHTELIELKVNKIKYSYQPVERLQTKYRVDNKLDAWVVYEYKDNDN